MGDAFVIIAVMVLYFVTLSKETYYSVKRDLL